jgi:hypothetical protein
MNGNMREYRVWVAVLPRMVFVRDVDSFVGWRIIVVECSWSLN